MAKHERTTTVFEQQVFRYLDNLRNSGAINMFTARPHIEKEFGLDGKQARTLLFLWMKNYNSEGKYEVIELTE